MVLNLIKITFPIYTQAKLKDKTLNEEEPENILVESDSSKQRSSGGLCPGAGSGLGVEWAAASWPYLTG